MGLGAVQGIADQQLMEEWIARYENDILRTCFFLLGDRSQAEDAAQDTFLKAWRSMAQFGGRNGSSEKTWLTRIAINTCKDYRRSKWLRHVDMSVEVESIPPGGYDLYPSDQSVFQEVMHLPGKYKQVILLYYYHHFTMEEIAQVLSAHVSTVHRQMNKAQEMLKAILTKEGFK